MSDRTSPATNPPTEPLTRREREVLELLARGLTGPEIAARLTLGLSTVKWHIDHVYGKLGVGSKRQAVDRAHTLGLLETRLRPEAPTRETPSGRSFGVPSSSLPQAFHPASTLSTENTAARPISESTSTAFQNLPSPVTRFFGREIEIGELEARLAQERLVTLTGLGGVGKTRLALRVAQVMQGKFSGGTWFVELAKLTDPALVPQQVANSIGLRDEPGHPILETLATFLRDRQLLLVLDNCEHLLEACARLADILLQACPGLTMLACSREALGVAGEAVFPVLSLPFPQPSQTYPVDGLTEFASVRLFEDRARLVRPAYEVAAHNATAVAHICQRVDGIPLAIEMAAARMNSLTAEQLAARLDDAFHLLTRGSRTALPRQQTLRATIDWSYQLLSASEQRLLQRLSVFAGGCTMAAAEAVCADRQPNDGLETSQVLHVLGSLVDKSMVVAVHQPGESTRYYLLEMVRQYAREKLEATGNGDRIAEYHRDYFSELVESGLSDLDAAERSLWNKLAAPELENLRLAMEWSFGDHSEAEAGPRLVLAVGCLLTSHQETIDWLKRAVAWCQSHPEISARLHLRLLSCGAGPMALNDPPNALTWSKQAVAISRSLGPDAREELLGCLMGLGWTYMADLSDYENALPAYAEAETILRALGPSHFPAKRYQATMASISSAKAELANQRGHFQDAKLHATESLRLLTAISFDPHRDLIILGAACLSLGEADQARVHFLEAQHVVDVGNDVWHKPYARRWLALAELQLGNLERAAEYCRESLQQAASLPDYNIVASGLGLLACIWAKQGQPAGAARLAGAAAALWARQKRKPWEDSSLDALLPGWRESGQMVIQLAFEDGLAMSTEQAVAFAIGNLTLQS